MTHCDWYNPAPLVAWITPELFEVQKQLKKVGCEVINGGDNAEQVYRPHGAVYRPTVGISVDRSSREQLHDVAAVLVEAAARNVLPFRFVLHLLSEDDMPLGALDSNGSIAGEESVGDEIVKCFNLESDVHGIVWSMECGRREVFRHRRTIRCFSESAAPLHRDPIVEVLGRIPTGQLLDLSIGGLVSTGSTTSKWLETVKIRQIAERLQLLEWINGKILVNKSRVVGKELLFQYPESVVARGAQEAVVLSDEHTTPTNVTVGCLSVTSNVSEKSV